MCSIIHLKNMFSSLMQTVQSACEGYSFTFGHKKTYKSQPFFFVILTFDSLYGILLTLKLFTASYHFHGRTSILAFPNVCFLQRIIFFIPRTG